MNVDTALRLLDIAQAILVIAPALVAEARRSEGDSELIRRKLEEMRALYRRASAELEQALAEARAG